MRGGIGAVARDILGSLLGFCQDTVNGVIEPSIIKLYAAIKAMEWGYQMGFTNVQVEGDAMSVIQNINNDDTDFSATKNLIYEARAVNNLFQVCNLLHTRKEGNNLAHAISKDAFPSNTYTECPFFIFFLYIISTKK
ncbi:hypothetical protein CRYUN_Cryun04dG0103900 [Craigia yunnanensis]